MKSKLIGAVAAGLVAAAGTTVVLAPAVTAEAAPSDKAPEYPPFKSVTEGLTKVVSTADGSKPLIELYADKDNGKLLAVLPSGYQNKMMMLAATVSGGDSQAGVMGPSYYVNFKKYGKQLAIVQPNFNVKTNGDAQAKASVNNLYTGTVLATTPIISMAPGGRPVIDMTGLGVGNAGRLFGGGGGFGPAAVRLNPTMVKVTKAKAFPKNTVVEFESPNANGRLTRITYSLGSLEGTRGFKPREADPRVGYFYNWANDYAKSSNEAVTDRFIQRWHLEKADPSLKLSPPKQPIVWYIEHTTPIKFRRYVRQGIEMWNEAYEEIGITGAVVVYQQDAASGAHMEKDPEDARYNFFRWNTSEQSYAIGPNHSNPLTGEILDADVVWHQGLTRSVADGFANLTEELAEETFGPETLAWFEEHPSWDPRQRARLGRMSPEKIDHLPAAVRGLAREVHEAEQKDDRAWARSMMYEACRIGNRLSFDMSLGAAAVDSGLVSLPAGQGPDDVLDGLPEAMIGGMIRYISAHEVGHTLGLQHNWISSTIRTLEEINSEGFDGATVGSVMEYAAVNINWELGDVQGPYATDRVGPYDRWAIAFGYGDPKQRDEILARVAEPDLIFQNQMASMVSGDPRHSTWDLGKDNLTFAESRLGLAAEIRSKLLDEIVEDGESWAKARRRFDSLLGTQMQSLFIASKWVGGSFHNTDFKGDPDGRPPVEDVPVEQQRRALNMIIDHTFNDDSYGLTPELVRHLGKEDWWDPAGFSELLDDASYNVHDTVDYVQSLGLSLIMNPTKLRRIYDNEYRSGADTLTLTELLGTVTESVWAEIESGSRTGQISSFRRNLQREHLERLIDLALADSRYAGPATRTIGTLSRGQLRDIHKGIERSLRGDLDEYTHAHLDDCRERIERAMEASYVVAP